MAKTMTNREIDFLRDYYGMPGSMDDLEVARSTWGTFGHEIADLKFACSDLKAAFREAIRKSWVGRMARRTK